jgi:uncharacterized protein (DUF2252 family)
MPIAISSGADLLAAFEALEARRTFCRPELSARRRERLLASSAGFFRGAPELFYALLRAHRPARARLGRDARWVVGDVHLENIGVIAIGDGNLVFDFNDLDEAVRASPMVDVLRGAASAAVSALERGYGERVALRAAEALLVSYIRPLAEDPPRVVKALITHALGRTHEQLLSERCAVQDGARRS